MATNESSPKEKTCFQCTRPVHGDDGRCTYCILEAEASEAFWEVIVKHYPQAKGGDLSPERTVRQRSANADAIEEWISNNVPIYCSTCRSEIVSTINEGCFRDGECDACEYRRYRTQSPLLEALDYLLQQTVDMDLEYGIDLTEGEQEARAMALAAIAEVKNIHTVDSRERPASET